MAARESPVRMRDKTNAGNVFTVLRGVSEMRADAREHCARSLAPATSSTYTRPLTLAARGAKDY